MNYDHLREQYPDTISMEQLYQICHISKRKAHWLLEHGVIPAQDSGKQTRRFQIRLDDVIDFLQRRDAGEFDAMIPSGTFSSGFAHDSAPRPILDPEALYVFILSQWADASDMLTTKQASELCGYGSTSINHWLNSGSVQGVNYYGRHLISKDSLAEHLASRAGQCISVKSEWHRELLEEYQQQEQSDGPQWGTMSM